MDRLLYHIILPQNHLQHVVFDQILNNGISHDTKSNFYYMNVGKVNPEILRRFRPSNTPDWVDFDKCIGVDLVKPSKRAFAFPIFTSKLMVFDQEITDLIYDQSFFEDCGTTFEEALNFESGRTLEELFKLYWDSIIPLESYLETQKYKKPQVVLFEPVPSDIIKIIEP